MVSLAGSKASSGRSNTSWASSGSFSAPALPAIACVTRAQSCADFASGPTVSRLAESGIAPWRETSPQVGFSPVTPQIAAGRRIDPPVSEPRAAKVARAATIAPEPEEEPPVMCAGFQGLRTWPVWSL